MCMGITSYMEAEIMTECEHVKIQLLVCVYDMESERYNINMYTYCNNCAIKMGEKEVFINKKKIPKVECEGVITKVVCNVKTNGHQYTWFGQQADWDFYIEHGDKWE